MSLSEGKRRRLDALSDSRGVIAAAAMDQRGSLQKSIAAAKGVPTEAVTREMLSEFKVAVSRILTPHASAIGSLHFVAKSCSSMTWATSGWTCGLPIAATKRHVANGAALAS